MIIIKQLAKDIRRELQAAEHYAMFASRYAEEHRELSEVYARIAEQELEHADKFHAAAVRIITEHREKHGEPPTEMAHIWDWEHQMLIEQEAVIRDVLKRR